jgi:hypothetical protein
MPFFKSFHLQFVQFTIAPLDAKTENNKLQDKLGLSCAKLSSSLG